MAVRCGQRGPVFLYTGARKLCRMNTLRAGSHSGRAKFTGRRIPSPICPRLIPSSFFQLKRDFCTSLPHDTFSLGMHFRFVNSMSSWHQSEWRFMKDYLDETEVGSSIWTHQKGAASDGTAPRQSLELNGNRKQRHGELGINSLFHLTTEVEPLTDPFGEDY